MPGLPKLDAYIEELLIQEKQSGAFKRIDLSHPFALSAQLPFLQEVQRQHAEGKPVRIIICKARQLGMSTITEALLFLWGIIYHPGTHGLVIAHERSASQSLFEKTQRYWDTWPMRRLYKLSSRTHQRLVWSDPASQIQVATAQNLQSGVGQTLQFIHGSEVALWPEPEELMTGLAQTVPQRHGTAIILESTARGVGNYFHEMYLRAKAGKSDYVPMFFPWFNHYEYTAEHVGIPVEVEDLDDVEEELVERYNVGPSQLAWRRYTIENQLHGDTDRFRQEYPANDEEAFLLSGRPVFPLEALEKCYEPRPGMVGQLVADGNDVRFQPRSYGELTVFVKPHPQCTYVVAGDPTHAMHDRGCIQVLNRVSLEQVAVWHGVCHPAKFGDHLIDLARYYNDAILNTEVTGPGNATIGTVMAKGYPNVWMWRWADRLPSVMSRNVYGFQTNWKSKEWAIGWLAEDVFKEMVVIHDAVTYHQMRDYAVVNANGEYGPGTRRTDEDTGIGYDDAVMALAIGLLTVRTEPSPPPVEEDRQSQLVAARNLGPGYGKVRSAEEMIRDAG